MNQLIDDYDFDRAAGAQKYGSEFLTWLLWRGEVDEEIVLGTAEGAKSAEIAFGDRVVLASMDWMITVHGSDAALSPALSTNS